ESSSVVGRHRANDIFRSIDILTFEKLSRHQEIVTLNPEKRRRRRRWQGRPFAARGDGGRRGGGSDPTSVSRHDRFFHPSHSRITTVCDDKLSGARSKHDIIEHQIAVYHPA